MDKCGFCFNNTYTNLPGMFYSKLNPIKVESPKIIVINSDLAHSIGLDFSILNAKEQAELFSGNKLPEGASPFAQAYAGHQFGHFTVLGDGRAIVLGEHITPDRERLDIQFKGSGRTPYSRGGDGRAALGPMLREYIISDAMHYLGIPTTRSLAVVATGEYVLRDSILPGAILTRVAKSHIRIGTFELAEERGDLLSIMNYTIERHYPDIMEANNRAVALIKSVMEKQADLIVHWMRVGFIHGVMNTDNITLSGQTIDYGPCAFMDIYNDNTVYSSIDHMGRYSYSNQPKIGYWNLVKLAEAILPLIDSNQDKAIKIAEDLISQFPILYEDKWLNMMRSKLGLFGEHVSDKLIIRELLNWMQRNNADYTNTFRDLSSGEKLEGKIYQQKEFHRWHQRWQERLKLNSNNLAESINLMKKNNPVIIPRNHKIESILSAAYKGDLQPLNDALNVFKAPYIECNKDYKLPPNPNEYVYQTFCGT